MKMATVRNLALWAIGLPFWIVVMTAVVLTIGGVADGLAGLVVGGH